MPMNRFARMLTASMDDQNLHLNLFLLKVRFQNIFILSACDLKEQKSFNNEHPFANK